MTTTHDARITIRLPAEAAERWRAAAERARLPVSEWIRQTIDGAAGADAQEHRKRKRGRRPSRRPYTAADPAVVWGIARVSNRLNEIARAVTANNFLDISVLEQLQKIELLLLQFLSQEDTEHAHQIS